MFFHPRLLLLVLVALSLPRRIILCLSRPRLLSTEVCPGPLQLWTHGDLRAVVVVLCVAHVQAPKVRASFPRSSDVFTDLGREFVVGEPAVAPEVVVRDSG